jgi:transcriptional regulator with XRE-family HTH domain
MVSPYDARYELLVQRLRRAREEAGLTQTAVGKKLGLSQPLVWRIEAGQRKIDPIEFVILCRLYKRSARYFLPDLPL